MCWATADLCDAHGEAVQVAEPVFRDYGGHSAFCGTVSTVRAWEDNSLVRMALEEEGVGRVLVVDGGALTSLCDAGRPTGAIGLPS